MRIIVFFDLPTGTSSEIRAYTKFRKYLINEGFIMLQKSVYTKLAINDTTVKLVKARLLKHIPPDGLVQILILTESQFAKIETLTGDIKNNVVDTTERLLFI